MSLLTNICSICSQNSPVMEIPHLPQTANFPASFPSATESFIHYLTRICSFAAIGSCCFSSHLPPTKRKKCPILCNSLWTRIIWQIFLHILVTSCPQTDCSYLDITIQKVSLKMSCILKASTVQTAAVLHLLHRPPETPSSQFSHGRRHWYSSFCSECLLTANFKFA